MLRRRAGKRVPPHLVKMRAADTLSVVFPQALACGENIVGPREVPDHPLVFETVRDTTEFKYNCNLVLIDFFVRHGLLSADDPSLVDIVSGLKKDVPAP